MWHTIFIVSHAATGLIALVTGIMAMRDGRLFDVYLWTLAGMTGFLMLAIAVQWGTLDAAARVLFAVFAGLAVIMVGLALRARRNRPTGVPSPRYLDDVGFTVVALFDAFCVIAVLDIGAPIWAVVGTGVVIAIAGHSALRWAKITLGGVGHVQEVERLG
jgi:hypothetical protein